MADHDQADPLPLQVTFHGFVANTMDALTLFEACLSGHLNHVPRRPHDRDRKSIIRSGSIFIYEEHCSGIKRWTDGVTWSPSRILGNFLLYRELENTFQPGEKKRATKRDKSLARGPRRPQGQRSSATHSPTPAGALLAATAVEVTEARAPTQQEAPEKENEIRALVGSLVDSYPFKERGLVKKTISVKVNDVTHHMVSYYSVEDALANVLPTPCQDTRLSGIVPRYELYNQTNFRSAVDDTFLSVIDQPRMPYGDPIHYAAMAHAQQYRSLSLPGPFTQHPSAWPGTPSYAQNPAYNLPQTYPTAVPSYEPEQQLVQTYPVDSLPYRQAEHPHSFSHDNLLQARRNSALPSAPQVPYTMQPLQNGTIDEEHSMPSYSTSNMFAANFNTRASQGTTVYQDEDDFAHSLSQYTPASSGTVFGSTSDTLTLNHSIPQGDEAWDKPEAFFYKPEPDFYPKHEPDR